MNLFENKVYQSDLDQAIASIVNLEELNNQTVLVTGATGTIGSFAVEVLARMNQTLNSNIQVLVAGRNINKLHKRFETSKEFGLSFVAYDMLKPIQMEEKADYIIHAAGNAHPVAFNTDPVGTIMGNVDSTYQLLEYARECESKCFLYVSSGEVYGQGDLSLEAFQEDYAGYVDVTSARSCYPMSKRLTENLCCSYAQQYGLKTVNVRPCHTYGPTMTLEDSRAQAQFVRNALAGENIIMKSAGTQLRSYCYVADCVSGLFSVLLNGKNGEVYNLANSKARVTIAEFASIAAEVVGKEVVFENPSELDIAYQTPIAKQVLDTKRLEALGWQGNFSVKTGIAHTIQILGEE